MQPNAHRDRGWGADMIRQNIKVSYSRQDDKFSLIQPRQEQYIMSWDQIRDGTLKHKTRDSHSVQDLLCLSMAGRDWYFGTVLKYVNITCLTVSPEEIQDTDS